MKFVCYTDWSQLPESANELFDKGAKQNMFLSRPWYENLVVTTLTNDQAMLLACVVEGDTMLAILPLIKHRSGYWFSLSHSYSSLYSLLLSDVGHSDSVQAKNTQQQEILACLARGLSQLSFRSLSLKPFDENDTNIFALQKALEAVGMTCHRGFRFFNWSYPVQGQNFEQYMSKRPGRVRSTIARKQRKLEREHECDIRLFIDQDIQQAMADYNAVYKASWKAHEQCIDLMDGLVKHFAKQGWLRLAVLYIHNQPAAAQLWFVVHRKASIFRLAYDETWKQYSPGSILTRFLMEYVIDTDKVDEIDFLTGNERYKQDWMSQQKARYELVCANNCKSRNKGYQVMDRLKGIFKTLS